MAKKDKKDSGHGPRPKIGKMDALPTKAGKRKLYKTQPMRPVVHHLHSVSWWRRVQKKGVLQGNLIDGQEPVCPGCDRIHLAVG